MKNFASLKNVCWVHLTCTFAIVCHVMINLVIDCVILQGPYMDAINTSEDDNTMITRLQCLYFCGIMSDAPLASYLGCFKPYTNVQKSVGVKMVPCSVACNVSNQAGINLQFFYLVKKCSMNHELLLLHFLHIWHAPLVSVTNCPIQTNRWRRDPCDHHHYLQLW